jgi:hypothetical protein
MCLSRVKGSKSVKTKRQDLPTSPTTVESLSIPSVTAARYFAANMCARTRALYQRACRPHEKAGRSPSTPACTAAPTARQPPNSRVRQPPQSVTPLPLLLLPPFFPQLLARHAAAAAAPPPPCVPRVLARPRLFRAPLLSSPPQSPCTASTLCRHTYICICIIYIYMHIYIHTYIHTYMCVCVCVCVCVCLSVCLCVCVYTYTMVSSGARYMCV